MENNSKNPYKFFVLARSIFNRMGPSGSSKFIWAFAVITIFFLAGFFLISHAPKNFQPENIKYVKIAGQDIKVYLAATEAERERGLGGRSDLKENEGMLFIFPQSGNYLFWMKDMNFPIDMIWLGEDLKVIYIKKNARPELYPETYGPGSSLPDAKYVLEVVSGFANKNNLKVGDRVEFD